MLIAILLCGHIRSWSIAKSTFVNCFLSSKHTVHVYAHTYNKKLVYHPFIVGNAGIDSSKNLSEEIDQSILDDLSGMCRKVVVEDQTIVNKEVSELAKKHCLNTDILSQIRKVKLCNELLDDLPYDLVIKTRFDIIYQSTLDNLLSQVIDLQKIHLLDTRMHAGVNDCIIIGTKDNINNLTETLLDPPGESDISTKDPHIWLHYRLKGNYSLVNFEFNVHRMID